MPRCIIAVGLAVTFAGALIPAAVQAQTPLRAGAPVSGQLTSSDPTLPDNSHYDCYSIDAPAGRTLTVTQRSTAFDSYLMVGKGSCAALTNIETNDDMPGGGLDSQVVLQSTGGTYVIRANSYSGGATGAYTIQAAISETAASPGGRAAAPVAAAQGQGPRLTPVPPAGANGTAPMTFDRAVECGAIWLVRFLMPENQHYPRDVVDNFRTMAGVMLDRAEIEGRSQGRSRQDAQSRMAETAALLHMSVDAAGVFPEGETGLEMTMNHSDVFLARSAVAAQWEPYENGCIRDARG